MLFDALAAMRNPVSNAMIARHQHELGLLDSGLRIAPMVLSPKHPVQILQCAEFSSHTY
jgi:hypothetical protein